MQNARYVPRPTEDQCYQQQAVGATPFGSQMQRNASFEQPHAIGVPTKLSVQQQASSQNGDVEDTAMSYRMTYPASVSLMPVPEGGDLFVAPSRSANNVFLQGSPAFSTNRPLLASAPQPNTFWQHPAITLPSDAAGCTTTGLSPSRSEPLPRDTYHPLLSALQASENAKARAFNPASGYLSNARRTGPPCESHQQQAHRQTNTTGGDGNDGADGEDNEDGDEEDGSLVTQASGTGLRSANRSKRGDVKTAIGRAYCSEGGYHDPDQYSSKTIEFASTQPKSLTAIAAKALASAIHDKPSHAIPANVTASRNAAIFPNSGPVGSNANQHNQSGLHDSTNPIVPPTPSFRNLSSDVKGILLTRGRDTRSEFERALHAKYAPILPPPMEVDASKYHSVREAASGVSNVSVRGGANRPGGKSLTATQGEQDKDDNAHLGAYEVEELLAAGTTLSTWAIAHRTRANRVQTATASLPQNHLASKTTPTAPPLIVTPTFLSTFTSLSSRPQYTQLLNGVGVRMGDALTQAKPPSQSSFLQQPERVERIRQFTNAEFTPSNVYGFDEERFLMLLSDRGAEVEEFQLEGVTHIPTETLEKIADFCPSVRLLDFSGCLQLSAATLAKILRTCRQIAYLNLSRCVDAVTPETLKLIFERCPNLIALSLNSLPHIDRSFDAAWDGLPNVPHLRVLDLGFCERLTETAAHCVARYTPGLEILDLTGCKRISNSGLASLGQSLAALRVLRICLCDQLSAVGFQALPSAARNIEILDLSGCKALDGKTLEVMVKRLHGLKSLNIGGCDLVNNQAIITTSRNCRALVALDISSCHDVSLESCIEIVNELSNMRRLTVSESAISNAQVVMLSSLRDACKIVRNQFRAQPLPSLNAFRAPAPAPKAKKGKDDKKKKK